jgi:hypothetical protein
MSISFESARSIRRELPQRLLASMMRRAMLQVDQSSAAIDVGLGSQARPTDGGGSF